MSNSPMGFKDRSQLLAGLEVGLGRRRRFSRASAPFLAAIALSLTPMASVGQSVCLSLVRAERLRDTVAPDSAEARVAATLAAARRALEFNHNPLEAAALLVRHSQALRSDIALFVSTGRISGLDGSLDLNRLTGRNDRILDQFDVIENQQRQGGVLGRLLNSWRTDREARIRDSARTVAKSINDQRIDIERAQATLDEGTRFLEILLVRHKRLLDEIEVLNGLAPHFTTEPHIVNTLSQEAAAMTDTASALGASIKALSDQLRVVSTAINESQGLNSISRMSVQTRMAEDLCIARGYCPGEMVYILPPQTSLQNTSVYRTPWRVVGATPAGELVVEQEGVVANIPVQVVARTSGSSHVSGLKAGSFAAIALDGYRPRLLEILGVFPDQSVLVRVKDMLRKVSVADVHGFYASGAQTLLAALNLRVKIGDLVSVDFNGTGPRHADRLRIVGVIPPGHPHRTAFGGSERVLILASDHTPDFIYFAAAEPLKLGSASPLLKKADVTSGRPPTDFAESHQELVRRLTESGAAAN